MTGEALALELLALAIRVAPVVAEVVTGQARKTLEERIERARKSVKDPIDTSAADTARRAELERIVAGR